MRVEEGTDDGCYGVGECGPRTRLGESISLKDKVASLQKGASHHW